MSTAGTILIWIYKDPWEFVPVTEIPGGWALAGRREQRAQGSLLALLPILLSLTVPTDFSVSPFALCFFHVGSGEEEIRVWYPISVIPVEHFSPTGKNSGHVSWYPW